MRRSANQDSFAVVLAEDREHWERSGHLLIVADGMGAHAAGELASRLSVDLIPHHYAKLNRGDAPVALLRSLEEANSEIFRKGQANPEFRNMGTTTCALAILPEGAVIAHVGDSRVYRLRGTTIEQLTFDHSLVWEMRASGEVSEEALRNNAIPKNVITRSLGPSATVAIDLEGPFPLQRGDRFLLCSDGLSGQLTDEEIGVLLGTLDLQTAVQAMIDLANLRGGPDNITVVVADIVGDEIVNKGAAAAAANQPVVNYPVSFAVVAAICGLAGVVLAMLRQFPLAAISAIIALVAGVSGWVKTQLDSSNRSRTDHLGKGPYRKFQCKPTADFCKQLLGVINELKDWLEQRGPLSDEALIRTKIEAGNQAMATKDYRTAIKNFVEVMTSIMKDIKSRSDDSDAESIDY